MKRIINGKRKVKLSIVEKCVHPQRRTFEKLAELRQAAAVLHKHGHYHGEVIDWIQSTKRKARAVERTLTLSTIVAGKPVAAAIKVPSGRPMDAYERKTLINALATRIRHERRAMRSVVRTVHYTRNGDLAWEKHNGVFHEPGTIARLAEQRLAIEISNHKTPVDNSEHIGVEIEFFAPHGESTVRSAFIKARLHKTVCLGGDGSIQAPRGNYSYELRVCAKRSEYARTILRVCNVLKTIGAKVNKTCGLHVHLDMRPRGGSYETAFWNLTGCLDLLFAMQPHSRRENRFCVRNTQRRIDVHMDRYAAVNGSAYRRHRTVEVRLHAGTVNARKIVNWISLLLRIVDMPTLGNDPADARRYLTIATADGLIQHGCKLSRRLRSYIDSRVAEFSSQGAEDTEAA